MKRPNVIFITSDQHRADAIGPENPRVHTPHLDRMAQQGTRFAACVTPNLVCQPARASILTGLLPSLHGVRDNGIDLPPAAGEKGFAARLRGAGYRTAFFGKAHFSTKSTFQPTGTPEDRNSGHLYEAGWTGPYMGFDYLQLIVLGHFHKPPPPGLPLVGHWERWLMSRGRGEALEEWKRPFRPGIDAAQTWSSSLPVAWHSSSWTADRAIEWIHAQAGQGPLCAWISFPDPHHPFDCPMPWSQVHRPEDMLLPTHREQDLDRRPWWHRASLENKPVVADPEMLKYRESGTRITRQSDEQLAAMTANYYSMVSLVDHSVGRILDALERAGIQDETYVVFASDHGEMLGNHGLYLKHPTPYEDLLRVPLVVRGPGVAPGQVVDEPVSTLDLGPTFLEWAGSPADRSAFNGTSLAALAAGERQPRQAAYSEWHVDASRCGVELRLETVRTRTAKLTIERGSGAGELYDLAADPGEMDNLFEAPAAAGLRRELEALLDRKPRPAQTVRLPIVGMA